MLMTRIKGVSIDKVWLDIPFEKKIEVTRSLANYVAQIRSHSFPRIGSIYFEQLDHRNAIRTFDQIENDDSYQRKISYDR